VFTVWVGRNFHLQMTGDHLVKGLVQGFAGSRELLRDAVTIVAVFHHGLDTTNLTLNSAKSEDECALMLLSGRHGFSVITIPDSCYDKRPGLCT
jgi:hypothetical protein